jgi:hypothetical protein
MKFRILFKVPNVFETTGGEIVYDKDFVSALQIGIAQMRTNETGTAGD